MYRSVLYKAFSYARPRTMARAMQSNNARIVLMMDSSGCTSHLQGKQLPSLNRLLSSTCTFLFQNLSSLYVVGHQVVQPCTCKKNKILSFPILQSNHYNIMMASICTDQCCIRPPTARARTMARAMQSNNVWISSFVQYDIWLKSSSASLPGMHMYLTSLPGMHTVCTLLLYQACICISLLCQACICISLICQTCIQYVPYFFTRHAYIPYFFARHAYSMYLTSLPGMRIYLTSLSGMHTVCTLLLYQACICISLLCQACICTLLLCQACIQYGPYFFARHAYSNVPYFFARHAYSMDLTSLPSMHTVCTLLLCQACIYISLLSH